MRDVAHVHDGFQVQTNSVAVDGKPGALITIRKTAAYRPLAVIDGIRAALPDIEKVMPNASTSRLSLISRFSSGVFGERENGRTHGRWPDRAHDPLFSAIGG